jgi:CRP/FNR family transcriptional regulator, cyclic AMP receptor protein
MEVVVLSNQDLDYLRGLSIFAGLRDEVIARIGENARRLDITEDQILFREGEPAKEMVVVLDGFLDIVKRSDAGVEVCIARLGPGHVAGEMSLFDIQPRSADVWGRAPASVVMLAHAELAAIYREDKESYTLLVLNIAREISIRLRRLDAALANITGQIHAVTRAVGDRTTPPSPLVTLREHTP